MSNTKIDLEYPYNQDWKSGYLVVNGENRKTVVLYNSHADRSSTSYARYLVSVSLGRHLEKWEHVDHKDHDKTNDDLANLQVLTLSENNLKEAGKRGRVMVEMKCAYCGRNFIRRRGNSCRVPSYSRRIFCCGVQCSSELKKTVLSKKDREIALCTQFIREFRLHE